MNETLSSSSLAEMLQGHRPQLLAWAQREAGVALLRFESADDLVQGVHQEALRSAERLEWRGEEAFMAWLYQIARRHLNNRRDHWFAIKRNGANILRLTWTGPQGEAQRIPLADTATGPATFANRREQMTLATKALSLLLPRDREIVQWTAAGLSIEDQAARLGMSVEAAQRAKNRAIERLQKAFTIVSRASHSHRD